MSKQLKIEITSTVYMPAEWVRMYHVETGEVRNYSEIDQQDLGNWILWNSEEVLRNRDCFGESESDESIKITELED